MEDISVPRSFTVLTVRSKVAFQFPKYVVLLSINTIVQCLLKYEIPWLFHNLWRYRKINQIEHLFVWFFFFFATATLYTYTAEVKSTHFASIFFSRIHQVHTNLYEQHFKCICTCPCPISIKCALHGHNGFHILTNEHWIGKKYQRQHVEETSPPIQRVKHSRSV